MYLTYINYAISGGVNYPEIILYVKMPFPKGQKDGDDNVYRRKTHGIDREIQYEG